MSMKSKKAPLTMVVMLILILFTRISSGTGRLSSELILVGCTPGDPLMKSMLNILPITNVDFIRWNVNLKSQQDGSHTFIINLVFGEARQNTEDFEDGGEKLSFEGYYTITQVIDGKINKTIYTLHSNKVNPILLLKINDNLFHFLSPGDQLMVGNQRWSYTLSRKDPIESKGLPVFAMPTELLNATDKQIIFEGRTPCLKSGTENSFDIIPGCLKVKWLLTLNRDPVSLQPTTYRLHLTSDKNTESEGTWTIIKGSPSNSEAIIYQLDPDKPGKSLSLLAADENVIFFLGSSDQLLTGNADFSYTLNKKKREPGADDFEIASQRYMQNILKAINYSIISSFQFLQIPAQPQVF
jgi:hypothetical protein